MINKIDSLYAKLQSQIYHILFESKYKDKYSRIKRESLKTKDKAQAIIKAEIPKQYNEDREQTVYQLIKLKFKKIKNLKGSDEIFIAKETKDIDNRLTYVHMSIMFFVKEFLSQNKKVIKLVEGIAIERLKQTKVQNLIRQPIDFSKTDLGKDTQRQAKIGLNVIQRITRSGFPYRATFSLQEIQKKIKEIFLNMFGDIDFVAIRTKSGKIRKYTVKYYIHMITRTEMTYIKNKAAVQSCREWNCDLVQVSQHANPCPVCAPYENQIYSISGNHKIYPPLDLGWMHPHCQHGIDPYSEALGVAA
jgi:hypothetical protein